MTKRFSDRYYAIGLTLLFALVGAVVVGRHEMWRDEIQAWLIARDSVSLLDLAHNLKYEGHPALWYICLFALTRISRSPVIMQAFHLLCASASIYIFARYSPFSRLQRLLFTFGYFPVYEYSVISRNYAIGVLLLFAFAALFQRRYTKTLWLAVVLGLAAHTSVHVLIIVAAIVAAWIVDHLIAHRSGPAPQETVAWRLRLGLGIVGLAVTLSILQMAPPPDSGYAVGWTTTLAPHRLIRVITLTTRAFFPIPQIRPDFWGRLPLLETMPVFLKVQLLLAAAIMAWITLALVRKPFALITYVLGASGLLAFFYFKDLGGLRHHGLLFVVFILAAWIAHYCPNVNWFKPLHRWSGLAEKSLSPLLTILLLIHVVGGGIAVSLDYRYVFSHAQTTAAFIREKQLQGLPMVGYNDYAVSAVAGYLDKDQVYYPEEERWGSFVVWDKARDRNLPDAVIIAAAGRVQKQTQQDVLLILNHALDPVEAAQQRITELARFTGATIKDENFYLYRMSDWN